MIVSKVDGGDEDSAVVKFVAFADSLTDFVSTVEIVGNVTGIDSFERVFSVGIRVSLISGVVEDEAFDAVRSKETLHRARVKRIGRSVLLCSFGLGKFVFTIVSLAFSVISTLIVWLAGVSFVF